VPTDQGVGFSPSLEYFFFFGASSTTSSSSSSSSLWNEFKGSSGKVDEQMEERLNERKEQL